MITQVTFSDFFNAFKSDEYKDVFSYNALRALFDYMEDLENQTGEPIELDVVALCCEFTEWDTAAAAVQDYTHDDLEEPEALQWLQNNTTVIPFDGGVIVADF